MRTVFYPNGRWKSQHRQLVIGASSLNVLAQRLEFSLDPFKDRLSASLQSVKEGSPSSLRRLDNILWVEELELEQPEFKLEFKVRERRIHLGTTHRNESIHLQYPGKESKWKESSWKVRNPRDFRPKILLGDKELKDLRFRDVWRIILDIMEEFYPTWNVAQSREPHLAPALAMLFYRMAFMLDHSKRDPTLRVQDLVKATPQDLFDRKFPSLWQYDPPTDVLEAISHVQQSWGGLSLEAFLRYNELMAWNEDSKYYNRNVRKRKKRWIDGTGRVNTLLTHARLIGVVTGDVKLADFLEGFSQSGGVSPATPEELLKICTPLLRKQEKANKQSKLT